MVSFNYSSLRAEKARFAAAITKPIRALLAGVGVCLGASGLLLLAMGDLLGWLAVGVSVIPIMIVLWHKGELSDIPNGRSQDFDDIASSALLGAIGKRPSPREISVAVMQTPSGQFMAIRFGLTANFFANLLSADPKDSAMVWGLADEVRREAGQSQITGATMSVALVRSIAGYETLLAHMKLDYSDLLQGVEWRRHIKEVRERHYQPRRTGGIARDWSFGYIPTLERFGMNVSESLARGSAMFTGLEHHQAAFDSMIERFSEPGRQNIVLVGPTGVGKTTLVYALADRLLHAGSSLPSNLQFRQVFSLDASALIAAAPGRGELENLVSRVIYEAHRAKNIILCLDDAQLFFDDSESGAVDIANTLQPILETGNVRIIMTVDEQSYLRINQKRPSLFGSINRVNIYEPDRTETMKVLENRLIVLEAERQVIFTFHAVSEAYRLSLRYVHDVAMPARAFKLLEAAVSYADSNRLVTAESVTLAIEQISGVKIGVASASDEKDTLLNLEGLIHQRMINQSRAVKVVSDALRRARAGVRNENRPIGTFLFLGPTGVGKTELAKALSAVYFGSEDNIVRLDLNEFVQTEDVARLLADGADNPDSLTAQVMKKPFSVVLLDEIEKAHPAVLTTLLQLLDEGVLRDHKNREVSFRDAIIIATSNAGADRIREYIERGYSLEQFEEQFTNELISSGQFKPEFLNRFDEIVVFKPLEQPELRQIVDLMLAGVNKTLAQQKVTVAVDDDARDFLVSHGYDPRLGARPMRRMIQRSVENVVAKLILADQVTAGHTVTLGLQDIQDALGVK